MNVCADIKIEGDSMLCKRQLLVICLYLRYCWKLTWRRHFFGMWMVRFWMCDLNALYYFIENVRSVAFQRGQWIVMSPEYDLYTENMLFVVGFVRTGSALLNIL